MLAQILYFSTACIAYRGGGNLDVLASARRHNIENKITGFLFRTPDHFVQLLEGKHDDVLETMGRIKRDYRHTAVVASPLMMTPRRGFATWLMGYADAVEPEAFEPIVGADRNNHSWQEKRAHFVLQTRPYVNPSQYAPIEADWGTFFDIPERKAES